MDEFQTPQAHVPPKTLGSHGPNTCIDPHRACWHVKCVLGVLPWFCLPDVCLYDDDDNNDEMAMIIIIIMMIMMMIMMIMMMMMMMMMMICNSEPWHRVSSGTPYLLPAIQAPEPRAALAFGGSILGSFFVMICYMVCSCLFDGFRHPFWIIVHIIFMFLYHFFQP